MKQDSVGKLDTYTKRGAMVAPVADYTDVAAVSEALAGIDVVISTLSLAALQLQVPIAQASKAAGVRLFVPSEFGVPKDDAKEGLLAVKAALIEQLRNILPFTQFFTGSCPDIMWLDMLNLNIKSGRVAVGDDGNAKVPFTSRSDIARFVVYVLTVLPLKETKNKSLKIAGERIVRRPFIGRFDVRSH